MGVATKKIAQYHSNNTNDLETRRAKAWPNRTFGSAFYFFSAQNTCAVYRLYVVVVYPYDISDTSDSGVVAQREVDQCVSILVQTTSTFSFFFVCYN